MLPFYSSSKTSPPPPASQGGSSHTTNKTQDHNHPLCSSSQPTPIPEASFIPGPQTCILNMNPQQHSFKTITLSTRYVMKKSTHTFVALALFAVYNCIVTPTSPLPRRSSTTTPTRPSQTRIVAPNAPSIPFLCFSSSPSLSLLQIKIHCSGWALHHCYQYQQ